jgi:hypothetical protein
VVWTPACFVGLALPSMLSVQFLPRGTQVADWAAAGRSGARPRPPRGRSGSVAIVVPDPLHREGQAVLVASLRGSCRR